jgi:hypothetical protein
MATSKTKQTAKEQGVPDVYLGPSGNFRMGMDARYKSDLVLSVAGATEKQKSRMLRTFRPADARKRLAARGWTGWLDRKLAKQAAPTGGKSKQR